MNGIDDIYIVCEVGVFGSASDALEMVVSGMSESDQVWQSDVRVLAG